MPMELDLYKSMLQMHGNTMHDRCVSKTRQNLARKVKDSAAVETVVIDGVKHEAAIISTSTLTQKTMVVMHGDDFKIGQIVEWNKCHWLIIARDMQDAVDVRGTIELCNRQLTWQNPNTGEIFSRWATVAKPYYSNLDESNAITLSRREFNSKLPYDSETAILDIGMRFMPEIINGKPKTYRITSVNTMTERFDYDGDQIGFLSINFEQDQYDRDRDNKELMICDYFDPAVPDSKDERALEIVFHGDAYIKCGTPRKIYTAKCDGAEVDGCTWTLENGDKNVLFADGSEKTVGTKCAVKCKNDKSMIGKTVSLRVSKAGFVPCSLKVEVISQ